MNWNEWTKALSEAVNSQIEACYIEKDSGRWHEDIITADILRALKKLHNRPIWLGNIYRSTSWNAYKLKGTSEQIHGDIALIVKIHLETGKSIEGIAFLEAKRIKHGRDISSGSFSSIKWDRLKKYSDSSPAHYTILYDYLSIKGKEKPFCKSIVTKHLIALNKKNRTIYKHSESIANLLSYRLLMGHGIDYREHLVSSVSGFSKSDIKYKYVITANILLSKNLDLIPDVDPTVINNQIYSEIETIDIDYQHRIQNDIDPSFNP